MKRRLEGDDTTSDEAKRPAPTPTTYVAPAFSPKGTAGSSGRVIYVLSHGTSYVEGEVKIPEGVEVNLHTDVDSYTLRSVGLAVLNAGSSIGSHSQYRGSMKRDIHLTKWSDFELIQHLASLSAATDGVVYVVGADVHEVLRKASVKNPVAKEIKSLPDSIGLAKVFALLAGDIAGGAKIHFVACRPEVGRFRDLPTTVSLGHEQTPANEKATLGNVRDLKYAPDDQRYIVLLARRYHKMRTMGVDYATFLSEYEALPQATRAALAGIGLTAAYEWKDASLPEKEWPKKDEPAAFKYGPLWGRLGHPPTTLTEAWLVNGWRNLFWKYMHGPQQIDGVSHCRLMLWIAVKKHFNPTVFPTDTGLTLSAPEVLDSHILDMLTGQGESTGMYPGIDHTALEDSIGRVGRFSAAASLPEGSRERGISMKSFDQDDLDLLAQCGGDITATYHEAQVRNVMTLRQLEVVVDGYMHEWWEHFRIFIYGRWAKEGITPA
ncbi:hypothetical protein [Streptomyces sp. NBC_01264]|uniref:hypothetical protein n=1 Tax=Streptomyces sp. NBC_01264 TaxID=2903804 RepID=UPI002252132F|nr:hypothetical protein [Streptomyces sp. NBC_01264]MCX4781496.1 hypothetical protein [Streptomyces sp. NBC_01264]